MDHFVGENRSIVRSRQRHPPAGKPPGERDRIALSDLAAGVRNCRMAGNRVFDDGAFGLEGNDFRRRATGSGGPCGFGMEYEFPADMEIRHHSSNRARRQRQDRIGLEHGGDMEQREYAPTVKEEPKRVACKEAHPLNDKMMLVAYVPEGPQAIDQPVDRCRNEICSYGCNRQTDKWTQAVNRPRIPT